MIAMLLENQSLMLSVVSILIDKGIITREELEKKREVVFKLMLEYDTIMETEVTKDRDEENKKLDRLIELSKLLTKECNLDHDSSVEQMIRRLFENRK